MKKIAVIFSNSPYGSNLGNAGMNFILSASCYTQNLDIFFIGDGVFQIIDNQHPKSILMQCYTKSFNILSLCNIDKFYVCYNSLIERGLSQKTKFIIQTHIYCVKNIKQKINKCDHIINF